MRVVHYYPSFDPAHGGPPAVILELAKEQIALGCDVVLLSRDVEPTSAALRDLRERGLSKHHRGIELSARWRLPNPFAFRDLNAFVRDADVLHIHGLWDITGLLAARLARLNRKPYVLTPHGMLDRWSLDQKKTKKRLGLKLGFARMVRNSALLHVLNADEYLRLVEVQPPSNVATIPNGVPFSQYATLPIRGRFRASYPEIGDHPYVLFMSRLHHKKGLDILALAFQELRASVRDVQLVVIGPDQGALAPFQKQVSALGIAEHVHILGGIYGRQKIEALRDASVYCLPSRQEGFSVAILEAMACGVPCVVTTGCNFPEVARAGAGLIVELDPKRIAEALQTVLEDQAASAMMGRRARTLVLENYTWKKIAEQMLSVYQRVVRA